jgi:predicted peptidase
MQNRKLRLLTLFLILATTSMAQKAPAQFSKHLHISKGDTLPYGMLEPLRKDPAQKYPLVIFLHGAGERGNDNEEHLKHIEILFSVNTLNKYPCYVIAPQCPKKQVWSNLMLGKPFSPIPTRPMQLFIEVYDKILKELPIDPSRIYVTGVSMGGYGTWDLLARFPTRFAGAVPICGGGDEKTAGLIKNIPIWAFHGALDETVPPRHSRKMIAAIQALGGTPGYTEYPGVKHPSWNQAYKEPMLMAWLFKQTLDHP